MFKNPVRTSKKTQHFTIAKVSWVMLFNEIISFCTENYTELRNTKYTVADC
jgi:hypothetical protein